MPFTYPNRDFTLVQAMVEEAVNEWPDSIVLEDGSYTLRELVENFTTGEFTNYRGDESGFDDDVDFDNVPESATIDFDRLDLAELTELRAEMDARINHLEAEQKTSSAPSAESEDAQSSAVGDSAQYSE